MKQRGSQFERERGRQREDRVRLARRTTTTRSVRSDSVSGTRPERESRQPGGRRRPSVSTGTTLDRVGAYVDKIYGNQGHRKGRKNKPRRSLTLGNQVRRKTRKRVEEKGTKDSQVLSPQRVRQRMGGVWDRRHLGRRKTQRGVRTETRGSSEKRVKRRDRYRLGRECEVRENARKRRERQEGPRGARREGWRVKEVYGEEPRRREEKEKEGRGVKERTRERGKTRTQERTQGKRERERRRKEEPIRANLGERQGRRADKGREESEHVRQTGKEKKLNRENKGRSQKSWGRKREVGGRGRGQDVSDPSRQRLPGVDTHQGFQKRKNLSRRAERDSLPPRERKKWRKVPEAERTQRKPEWGEIKTRWEEEMGRLEQRQRAELRQGKPSPGTPYVDLGKSVLYAYGRQRNRRRLR
jgi:hypothetical protein